MKTDKKDVAEGKAKKYRMVELDGKDGKRFTIEMNPDNCNRIYHDPNPRLQLWLALGYESCPPKSRKMLEKEGYVYRPSESFPAEIQVMDGSPEPAFEVIAEPEKGLYVFTNVRFDGEIYTCESCDAPLKDPSLPGSFDWVTPEAVCPDCGKSLGGRPATPDEIKHAKNGVIYPKRAERPGFYKAKVQGIKGLVAIERTPANLAREFDISESTVRRMMERVDREMAGREKHCVSMADREQADRKYRRALLDAHDVVSDPDD